MANTEHKIIVVGIGPGSPDYILPIARQAINAAKVIVGGRRSLAEYASTEQKQKIVARDIESVLSFIELELTNNDVVVMVSGDPGYYSLLDAIRGYFDAAIIKVIPGISSMQLAFARVGLPWHDADLVSFHGRQPEESAIAFASGKILGMLTDTVNNSQTIAVRLLACGWHDNDKIYICTRLSYADENITSCTLGEAAQNSPISSGILLVVAGRSE